MIFNRYSNNKKDHTVYNNLSLLDYKEISKPESFDDLLLGVKIRDFDLYSKFEACRSKLHLHDGEFQYISEATCKDRLCPHCAGKRSAKQKMILTKYMETMKKEHLARYVRFVTLTYDNVNNLDDFDFKMMSKDLNRFTRYLKGMGYIIFGGYRTIEIKFDELKGYNIHIHMLYFADVVNQKGAKKKYNKFKRKYNLDFTYRQAFFYKNNRKSEGFIHYKVLNYLWMNCNHRKSYVTKPEVIRYGLAGGISYICKYLSKEFEGIRDPDKFIQVHSFINRKKLFQKFGSEFKDYKVSCYKTFYFGLSGQRIRYGTIIYDNAWNGEFYNWHEVVNKFKIICKYLPRWDNKLTNEENMILNSEVIEKK